MKFFYIPFCLLLFFTTNVKATDIIEIDHLKDKLISLTEKSDSEDNEIKKSKLLREIAYVYLENEDLKKSIINYRRAYVVVSKIKNYYLMSNVLIDIGNSYLVKNQFDLAVKNYFKALMLLKSKRNKISQIDYGQTSGIIYMNIGLIYLETKNYALALSYLKQASEFFDKKEKHSFYFQINYLNTGSALTELGEYKDGLSYYKKAVSNLKNKDFHFLAISNCNMGESFDYLGKYDKALSFFWKSLTYYNNSHLYVSEKAELLSKISKTYIHLNRLKEAKKYLDMAMAICQNNSRYSEKVYKVLVDYFVKVGDSQKALESIKLLQKFEETKFNSGVISNIAKYQSDFEVWNSKRKDQFEIQSLKRKQLIKTYKFYGMFSVIVIVFLIALLLLYKQKHKSKINLIKLENSQAEKKRIEEMLKFKNVQLTNYALHIVSKNEFFESIKVEVDNIKSTLNDNVELVKLSNFINHQLDYTQEKKEFNIQVSKANEDFYYKLDSKFPELTSKDKKLCSLIVLNLSNKEIATLMGISSPSVEKSRNRLRKKLNLSSETDLAKFFSTI